MNEALNSHRRSLFVCRVDLLLRTLNAACYRGLATGSEKLARQRSTNPIGRSDLNFSAPVVAPSTEADRDFYLVALVGHRVDGVNASLLHRSLP